METLNPLQALWTNGGVVKIWAHQPPPLCILDASIPLFDSDDHIQNKVRVNTMRPKQSGIHFEDDIFKCIFLNENVWISLKTSPNFVPKVPINNIPALVEIIAISGRDLFTKTRNGGP